MLGVRLLSRPTKGGRQTPDLTKSASPAVKEAVRLYRELAKLEKTVDRAEITLASKLGTLSVNEMYQYADITNQLEMGKAVVEMCTCGHSQLYHNDEVHTLGDSRVNVPGHGSCAMCDCKKYTWTSGR